MSNAATTPIMSPENAKDDDTDTTLSGDAAQQTVEGLVETLEDGRLGFEQAADALASDDHPVVADALRRFAAQRKELSADLRRAANEHGVPVDVDASGTTAGKFHRGWIELKDALTGDDAEAILEAVKQGEEHAVSEYRDALDELGGDIAATVRLQLDQIEQTCDEVASLELS